MSTSGSASSRSFPSACRTVLQFLPGNIGPLGDGGGVQQHLLGVRRSGSRGKELRATRSICELPFGPTHSSPTAQVPCARRALAGAAPRPLLRRALLWPGKGGGPCRIPAATVLPPSVLVVLEGRYFFM